MRVWANEWDVFHCTPSRGGRGRRVAVDIFRGVFLVFGRISCFFFVFFTSSAHGLLQVRGNLASCTSLLVYILVYTWYLVLHTPSTTYVRPLVV